MSDIINPDLKKVLSDFAQSSGRITVLTGSGISAESGIPTFRGRGGYWTIGSVEYTPQEIATYRMFSREPAEVWKWHLRLLGVSRRAQPNPGHLALVEMEQLFGDRFTLITQNIDGLHLLAGSSPQRTYQIHGNVHRMRCTLDCSSEVYEVPQTVPGKEIGEELTDAEQDLLRCPRCGAMARPHVLWFDEMYNEEYYHLHSSLHAAQQTDLLLVVGTSGATNLPNQVVSVVLFRGGAVIDINIEKQRFSHMALASKQGFFIQQPSGIALPELVKVF